VAEDLLSQGANEILKAVYGEAGHEWPAGACCWRVPRMSRWHWAVFWRKRGFSAPACRFWKSSRWRPLTQCAKRSRSWIAIARW